MGSAQPLTPVGRQTPSPEADPPMNRQTGVKTLPCPKLRLREVKIPLDKYYNPLYVLDLMQEIFSFSCIELEPELICLIVRQSVP